MTTRSVARTAAAAVFVLVIAAVLALAPEVGFFGWFWGGVAGLLSLGVLLSLSPRAGRTVGLLLLATTLLVLGALVVAWAIAWGTPLTSLEGLWLWPLGAGSVLAGLGIGRRALASRNPP